MKNGVFFFAIMIGFQGSTLAAVDCARAKENVDKLVCFNSKAAAAEERMALAFHHALQRGVSPEILRQTQSHWKKNVRDVCINVECIVGAHEERIAELYELQ